MYAPQRLVSAQILFRHPSLLFLPVLMGLCTLVPDVTRAFTPLYISTPPASSPSVRHSFASPSARQCQTRRRSPWDPTHDLMRHAMQTVGHDAAVETALPLLFGSWTLEEKRVIQPLWGMKPVRHAGALGIPDGSSSTFEVLLKPKGRLDQPVDSAVRGLDWTLNFKDMYATGRLEFKIVHPPPDKKLIANDQIPHIHYYSGTFCDGLNRVEGFVERTLRERQVRRAAMYILQFRLGKRPANVFEWGMCTSSIYTAWVDRSPKRRTGSVIRRIVPRVAPDVPCFKRLQTRRTRACGCQTQKSVPM
ncbi:hypothetical protein Naga_100028g30 [Nannochloropsis gaditana]|uniref:Uncharacterized protein n=1 Tax=Nannochloropsis gaditana TaxID=72520 RepID=W7U8V2_9STRA|nr:hypothetical protein Naga_100028g30 [Nannochloropsis gaditana]